MIHAILTVGFAMSPSIDALRLSQIETLWSIVGIAHGAASQDVIRSAQQELLKALHRESGDRKCVAFNAFFIGWLLQHL